MYELIWLNSAAIIIYYICCTNDAILLYENIFLMGKRSSPTVPDTNRRWWVHITNGWRTHHRRFIIWRWSTPSITAGSGTGGDGPAITIDLNLIISKTVGDVFLEPAVIGVTVVVTTTSGLRSFLLYVFDSVLFANVWIVWLKEWSLLWFDWSPIPS